MKQKDRPKNKSEIVWNLSSNMSDTRSTHHAYYYRRRVNLNEESYDSNAVLCNSRKGLSDGSKLIDFSDIDNDGLHEDKACKRCLNIYNKLNSNIKI